MTSSIVGEILHFEQANLIKTPGKDVNDVTIVGCALSKGIVELSINQ